MYRPQWERKLEISRIDRRLEKKARTIIHNLIGHVKIFFIQLEELWEALKRFKSGE